MPCVVTLSPASCFSALGLGPAQTGVQETAPETCAVCVGSMLSGAIAPYVPQFSLHASSLGNGLSGLRACKSHGSPQQLVCWCLMEPEQHGIGFCMLESSEDNLWPVSVVCRPVLCVPVSFLASSDFSNFCFPFVTHHMTMTLIFSSLVIKKLSAFWNKA